MSRDMNPDEIAQFTVAFGYPPTQLPVAIDMLAVFVHQDNPLESLTLEQLDALYSVGRKKGHGKEIRTWGDLGLTGDWANKPISLYGRNPASGTYVYFKEHVLEKGDFKPTVKQLGGSSGVIQGLLDRSLRHRLQRHRLQDCRRQGDSPGAQQEVAARAGRTSIRLRRHLPPVPLPAAEHKLQAEVGTDPLDGRIHPIRLQSAGADRRDQGRLFAGSRQGCRTRVEIGWPADFEVAVFRWVRFQVTDHRRHLFLSLDL